MAKPLKKSAKPVAKSATGKKSVLPKTSAKAASVKKKPIKSAPAAKVAPKKAPVAKKPVKEAPKAVKKAPAKAAPVKPAPPKKDPLKDPFLLKQKDRLLQLKDTLLDSMSGVAKDTLRARPEGSEVSAFDIGDAGNDAYDRDFALSLISQEQDALYEIDGALRRIDGGTYGVCEISGKNIPRARLEALPFTRYTVECQSELEKNSRFRNKARQPVSSLFSGGDDDDDGDDDSTTDSKD